MERARPESVASSSGLGMGKCEMGELLGVVLSMNSMIRDEALTQGL